MRKPIRIAMVAGTAGVIAAAGITAAFAVQGNSQQTQKRASDSTSATVTRTVAGKVSAERARQIARQLVPGGRVTETELDHEHGRAVWEVDLTKNNREYEVRIDATTGKVLGISASHASPHASSPAAAGKVDAQRARQIAQQRVPGTRVTEVERDREHGRAVWEVDLHKQHHEWEVTIDAATGKVISIHYDSGMADED